MVWGSFINSSSAMMAHSHAMGTVSQNIANVNTTGYKRMETNFKTNLSESLGGGKFDIFGTRAADRQFVEKQGLILGSDRWSDMAINGKGMFIVNTQLNGSGETLFTRNGAFTYRLMDGNGDGQRENYLVDSGGNFLQGWQADANGAFNRTTTLASLRPVYYEPDQMIDGSATTSVEMHGNIAAGATQPQKLWMAIYDDQFNAKNVAVTFTPDTSGAPNTWTVTINPDDGTSATTTTAVFNGEGQMTSPTGGTLTANITWTTGAGPSTIALDLSNVTQFSDTGPQAGQVVQNGYGAGYFVSARFDENGVMSAYYSNGQTRDLFQLPIANFTNANELDPRQGTMFGQTVDAGDLTISEVDDASMATAFVPGSLEGSNVDMAEQFSRMIMTQKAYSQNATVFKTSDEMLQEVTRLKS